MTRTWKQYWDDVLVGSAGQFLFRGEMNREERELSVARDMRDWAYAERNQVVAALAKVFPSGLAKTEIPGWDAEWHNCVYIDLPTGQVSWHFHDREAHWFAGMPAYSKPWDGHTTEEKYRRLNALSAAGDEDRRA